jgi:hypothetical protein
MAVHVVVVVEEHRAEGAGVFDRAEPARGPMVFSTLHIVLTAALTGVVALIVGIWRLPRKR